MPRFLAKYVHIRNEYAKVFLAELLGTFILVSVGLGSICQNKFFSNDSPYLANGLAINIGFALAGAVAIFVVGKVSGNNSNYSYQLLYSKLDLNSRSSYQYGRFIHRIPSRTALVAQATRLLARSSCRSVPGSCERVYCLHRQSSSLSGGHVFAQHGRIVRFIS